jgi:tetratricopeptide (TPR) repeat protein
MRALKAKALPALAFTVLLSIHCGLCAAALDPGYIQVTTKQVTDGLSNARSSPEDRIVQINQALNSGRIDVAYSVLDKRIKSGSPSALDFMLAGMSAGAYASCLNVRGPISKPAAEFRARLYSESDQWISKAYELSPNTGIVDATYGMCLLEAPSNASANEGLKLVKRSVKLSPGMASCHLCLAEALMDRIAARNSQTSIVNGLQTTMLVPPSAADLRDVFIELDESLTIQPNSAEAHQLLGDCYYFIGDAAKEQSEYKTANELRGGLSVVDAAKKKALSAEPSPDPKASAR